MDSETRRIARELDEVKQKAKASEECLETKRVFVRYMSHELRSPLNVIIAGLQLLARVTRSDDDAELMLEMRSACEFAIGMLDDLLAYERIETNNFGAVKDRVDLSALVRANVAQFQLQARCSKIRLEFGDCEDASSIVLADADKISQVIRNLLHNALKFTPLEGNVTIRLGLSSAMSSTSTPSSESPTQWARIEVQDSGPGIDPSLRSILFEDQPAEFSLTTLQQTQGAGLGLYLSRSIVSMHDGRIGVEQTRANSNGSLFFFELPVLEVVPKADNEVFIPIDNMAISAIELLRADVPLAAPSNLLKAISPTEVPRLLIVDDVKLIRKCHRRVLIDIFPDIVEAENGKDAVEMVRESIVSGKPFHGILMDSSMPVLNGVDATRQIRELGFNKPIFGVTGNAFQGDIDEFIQSGVDNVYIKPILLETYHKIAETLILKDEVKEA